MALKKDRSICKKKIWQFFCRKPLGEKSDTFFVSVIIKKAKKRYLVYAQAQHSPYLETQICGAIRYLSRVQVVFRSILKPNGLGLELQQLIESFKTIKDKQLQNAV